jgi:hypothetical protein
MGSGQWAVYCPHPWAVLTTGQHYPHHWAALSSPLGSTILTTGLYYLGSNILTSFFAQVRHRNVACCGCASGTQRDFSTYTYHGTPYQGSRIGGGMVGGCVVSWWVGVRGVEFRLR